MTTSRPFFLALVVALSAALGAVVTQAAQASLPETPRPQVEAPLQVSENRRTPVVEAVERVAPAVVSITTEVPTTDPFARFYGRSSETSQGSGVVIEPEGIVLTNAHVVQRASRIRATFADGSAYDADILGIATDLDLAVLRLVEAPIVQAVPIGSSEGLMLGEPVIAIGNPFGLGHTVTTGVVSAINRALETDQRVYQNFIQTDASINPGNSGGPLLDIEGRLVGINTAIRPDAEGIGFAIPSDRAVKVAHDLMLFGQVQIPWLGVDVVDVAVREPGGRRVAIQVQQVHTQKALRPGDLILEIDGRPVSGRADLNAFLAGYERGREVKLALARDGQKTSVSVRTGKVPAAVVERSMEATLGISVIDPTQTVRGRIAVGAVVKTIAPGGSFAQAGLKPGDVIMGVNGTRIRGVDDLEGALLNAKSGHWPSALLTIRRGNAKGQLTLAI